jgi:hypothetical protein
MNPIVPLRAQIWRAALRFGLASTAVFVTVAFAERWMFRNLGIWGAYAAWIGLFIILGGSLLRPLAHPPASGPRFHFIFGAAFLAYAAGWVGCYFTLRGVVGEAAGTLAGALLMALVLAITFHAVRALPGLFFVLCAANCAGYFGGRALFFSMPGAAGMLLFGIVYGLVFGTGLGIALHKLRDHG